MKRRRINTNPFSERIPREILYALEKASESLIRAGVDFVLIGGLALSYSFPSYPTEDVDFGVQDESSVPESIFGMKRLSKHMFEDKSGVIVDIVTSQHARVPAPVFAEAWRSAIVDARLGIRIASPLAIFAIKACRSRIKDQAHLQWMMRHGFDPGDEALLRLGVPEEDIAKLNLVRVLLAQEVAEEEEMGW